MSTNLWVKYKLTQRTFITKVPIDECSNIADFIKEIKKNITFAVPTSLLVLYKSDEMTEIDDGDSPADYLQGNSSRNPLIVKTAFSSNSNRLTSARKMVVDSTCQKYLNAIARRMSDFYSFHFNPRMGAKMADVLAVKDREEGEGWDFCRAMETFTTFDPYDGTSTVFEKGQKFITQPLPKLFEPNEWEKISELHKITSGKIHNAEVPRISYNTGYIIIPSHMYSDETVAFLKDIGVKSFLLDLPDLLEVMNEENVSESIFLNYMRYLHEDFYIAI